MILLIGLTLALSFAISIYFLRQWFLVFRPQTDPLLNSTFKGSRYTIIISALFYFFVLPLSYIELLVEAYRERKSSKTQKQNFNAGLGYRKISHY